MTCVVGLANNGAIYMGADSAAVSGWAVSIRVDRKIFRNGPYLIGFTSSFRMGQLLCHAFRPPVLRHADQDLYAFMVTEFISAARDCLKAGGFAERQNEAEKGGIFLVAAEGRLFHVDSDYQVGENTNGIDAVGCGADIALGAMFASAHLEPPDRIKIALQAAELYSAAVRGPFHIETSA